MLFQKRIEHTLLYIYFFITITEAISMLVGLLVAEGNTRSAVSGPTLTWFIIYIYA